MLAQLETALSLADHAAREDMRWWFLGLLSVGGLALWVVARYWAKQHDAMSSRLTSLTNEYTGYMKEQNGKLTICLAENTVALRQFSDAVIAAKDTLTKQNQHTR